MMRRPPDTNAHASGSGSSSAAGAASVTGSGSAAALTPFATVEALVQRSTDLWARDLRSLFEHARDRFADVSWETDNSARIWAHKAVVYVRAPKAFKDRYFLSTKTLSSRSPTSLSQHSAYPGSSLLSTTSARNTPSPSFFRGSTLSVDTAESDGTLRAPTLSAGGDGVLHLGNDDSPELFLAQLEWLYTGEGFGDVVEWINKEEEEGGDATAASSNGGSVRDSLGRRGNLAERRDKLGQDLTYMWTSKLYCDVRIHLESPDGDDYSSDGSQDSDDSLASTVIFTAHRFMLVSRSPYFSSLLLNPTEFRPSTTDIYLPTPPFTPAALHFCLGWIYAGHLDFSNRSFDLLTAFQIYRSANYLQLDALTAEVEARLVHDFCHGLEWSKCHCRKCLSRVPRVWRFACSPDVGALEIQRRARRFILTGWAECWNREAGLADPEERDDLVSDVVTVLSPNNVIVAFRGIQRVRVRMEHGIRTKGPEAAPWVDALGGMIEAVEKRSQEILANQFAAVCDSADLWDLIYGKGFNDDVFDLVLKEIVEVAGRLENLAQAPKMYQTIVSAILLRVHPETLETALPTRSAARHKIETAKDGVLAHIRRRWMQIKEDGGFSGLEPWALKEISDEIEVHIDELLARQVPFPGGPSRTTAPRVSSSKAPARTPRTSDASRASTVRSPVDSTDQPNGLRRLRLSSSASTSSVMSSRSTSRPVSVAARREQPTSGPMARSPTAASRTPIVSVGSAKGRASSSRTGANPPTPTKVMTGPPRPLLTGKTTASKVASGSGTRRDTASPAPSTPEAGPSQPLRHRQSTPVLRPQKSSPALRHQTSMASVKSAATAKTSTSAKSAATTTTKSTTPKPAVPKTPTAAAKAPVRSPRTSMTSGSVRTASSTSSAQRAGSSSMTASAKAGPSSAATKTTAAAKPAAAKPTTSTSTATATRTTTAAKTTRPTPRPSAEGLPTSKSTPTLRTRTLSSTSTRSKAPGTSSPAPALPSGAAASARSTAATKTTPAAARTPVTRAAAPRTSTGTPTTSKATASASPALRTSASAKSLSSRVAPTKSTATPPPKTPTTTKPRSSLASTKSDTLQTPSSAGSTRVRSTSLNPKSTPPSVSRQRTASGAAPAPWKRATPVPPQVAGVRQPRKSIRSSSGSTEGPHEAITPRLSNVSEPIIVVDDGPVLDPTPDPEAEIKEEKERAVETEAASDHAPVEDEMPSTPATETSEVHSERDESHENESLVSEHSVEEPTPGLIVIDHEARSEAGTARSDAGIAVSEAGTARSEAGASSTGHDHDDHDGRSESADAHSEEHLEPPTENLAVEETASDTASMAPSVVPSLAVSEIPSLASSDTPAQSAPAPVEASPAAPGPAAQAATAAAAPPVRPHSARSVPTVVIPDESSAPPWRFQPIGASNPTTPTRPPAARAVTLDTTPKAPSTPPLSSQPTLSADVTPTGPKALPPLPTFVIPSSPPRPDLPIAARFHRVAPTQHPMSPTPSHTPTTPASRVASPPAVAGLPTTPPFREAAVFGSPISIPIPTSSPPLSVLGSSPGSVSTHVSGSPLSTMSRIVSDASSARSQPSLYRPHPAHAFDPPPRKPPTPPPPAIDLEIKDDENEPFKPGNGVQLHVGIPCIVTLSQRRARFRANVKYLGHLPNESGAWVGLEVDDLERFGVETLPTGAKDGVRYFYFTKPSTVATDSEAKARRQRRIAAIAESLPTSRKRFNGHSLSGIGGANSLVPPKDPRRAASPFVADWAPPEKPRALFVRPHEVVFVMGAE